MKKKLNNVKGFTLVELLAVIVIMGILMMVAIPNISRITNNSKKKVFANNAEAYIRQARTAIDSEDIEAPEIGKPVFIPTEYLDMQSSNSPFTNKPMKGTIKVENISTNNEKKYKYYFSGLDDAKNGIDDWISEDQLIKSENYNFVKMNTESKAEGIDETKTEPYFNTKISFTIQGVGTYSTTSGSTWADWILSYGISSGDNGIVWIGYENMAGICNKSDVGRLFVDIGNGLCMNKLHYNSDKNNQEVMFTDEILPITYRVGGPA